MKKNILILILISLSFYNFSFAQQTDTLKLYFDIDLNQITTENKSKINALLQNYFDKNILKINIKGFTDYLGSDAYNQSLSVKRAVNVKKYLLEKHFANIQIIAEGKGKLPPTLPNNMEGIKENRKVEIIVFYTKKETAKKKENNPILNKDSIKTTIIYKINKIDTLLTEEININLLKDTSKTAEIGELAEMINETEIGKNIILKNVNFYPGRHFPMAEARPALEELIKVMKENPRLEIEIQGHICCVAYEHDCLDLDTQKKNLSKERAKYVYGFLIRNGINKTRLKYNGYGAKFKIFKEEIDEEERMQNRRVEIKILKK